MIDNLRKKREIEKYLDLEYISLFILTETEGLFIPEYLKNNKNVVLNISNYFQGSLTLLDEKIVTELTFNGKLETCEIPYSGIISITPLGCKTIEFKERPKLERVK